MDIEINKSIQITSNLINGGPISSHEWKIDNILQTNITDTLIINANSLSLGIHDIYYKGTNYCGNFTELNQQFMVEVNQLVT